MRLHADPGDTADRAWVILEPLKPPPPLPAGDLAKPTYARGSMLSFLTTPTAAPGGRCSTTSRRSGPWRTTSSGGSGTALERPSMTPSGPKSDAKYRGHRQPDGQASEVGGPHGFERGKFLTRRKRPILVETMGLLLAVIVTSAKVDDGVAVPQVLAKLTSEAFPRLAGSVPTRSLSSMSSPSDCRSTPGMSSR